MFTVLSLNLSKKRTHVEAFGDDMPSPKMRKLMQGAHESKESKIEEGNRISEAIGGFFQLLYAIVCCQVMLQSGSENLKSTKAKTRQIRWGLISRILFNLNFCGKYWYNISRVFGNDFLNLLSQCEFML